MKTKFGAFVVVASAAIGIIFLEGCKTSSAGKTEREQSAWDINGANLKLVAKYKPLHLYIYADAASTNKFPDFVIREGDYPIYMRANESNKVISIHAEKNLDNFRTDYDSKGNILRYEVNLGAMKYAYVDTNGDGLLDFFVNYSNRMKLPTAFVRSNLCWVPMQQK
jgi:hypothetical protein